MTQETVKKKAETGTRCLYDRMSTMNPVLRDLFIGWVAFKLNLTFDACRKALRSNDETTIEMRFLQVIYEQYGISYEDLVNPALVLTNTHTNRDLLQNYRISNLDTPRLFVAVRQLTEAAEAGEA